MSGLKGLFASACIVLLVIAGVCLAPAYASAASEPTPAGQAILKVDVTYSGVDVPTETFVIVVTPQDDAPTPVEGLEQGCTLSSHKLAGSLEFTFDLSEKVARTYRYTIEEKQGTTQGITYSSDVYTVEFETYFEWGVWYATPFRVVKAGSTEKPSALEFANTCTQPTPPSWIDGNTVTTKDTVNRSQIGVITFRPGSAPISSVRLIDPNTGMETTATEVDVFDAQGNKIGTYRLNPVGKLNADGSVSYEIEFIPVSGYVGTPPPITLRAYDENGLYADGIYQPVVVHNTAPGPRQAPSTPSKILAKFLPKTGDPLSFVPVGTVVLVASLLVVVAFKRRRKDESPSALLD